MLTLTQTSPITCSNTDAITRAPHTKPDASKLAVPTVLDNEDALIGWPDYQRGQVAVIFSTLYAMPARWNKSGNDLQVYKTFDEAHKLYREQLLTYHRMTDSIPDKFRLITSVRDLDLILDHWSHPSPEHGHPVGMVVLMEGADAIRDLSELEEWYELGVRLIGPAWVGTRYSGGWREPGPLTKDGRKPALCHG